jgi:hypothetical protein
MELRFQEKDMCIINDVINEIEVLHGLKLVFRTLESKRRKKELVHDQG